jgi:hypothetical protein
MESKVIEACKEALTGKNVSGVMALDQDGLCLFSQGLSEQLSGVINAIVNETKELDGEKHTPTIEIGVDKGRLLIHKHNHITTVIFKTS